MSKIPNNFEHTPQTGKKSAWSGDGGLIRRLRNHFITGIVVTAPIAITIYLVWQFIGFLDGIFTPDTIERLPFPIPGVGLLIAFVFLTLVGALTANFFGRWLFTIGENLLGRMPVVRSVYGTLKKIFETVLAKSSKSFREVVLVEYPRKGIWAIGFITGNTEGEISSRMPSEMVNIFLPTTPNPTSGFLLFLPKEDVIVLNMSVEEGIKLVISGGIMVPPDNYDKENLLTNSNVDKN